MSSAFGSVSLDRWRGRVALVTGASSGIGRAIAAGLAEAGMKVAVAARREDRLRALTGEFPQAELLTHPTDLRDEASIDALFARIRDQWGGVDVLVNGAGLGYLAPLTSGSTEDWRDMLEVNVLALCICTREAIGDMRARGDDGHIIHISSMSGYRVPSGSGVYAATKHAVRALTEALRRELREMRSGIRVTAISPGFVETEFAAGYHRSEVAAQATYGRFPVLQVDDIARSVAYVLAQPAHVQVHDILLRPTQQDT
jgi:NADP-dependent 3-hydroxy acid dehydrogenase YdfG